MTQKPQFISFDHVNVRTANLEESIEFYTKVLGFTYVCRHSLAPVSPTISAYVKFDHTVVELAFGHDLKEYSTAGMINHFCLTVPDIQEARSYFEEKQVTILGDIINVNDFFCCFFISGPSGERFEIIQYL